MAIPPPHYNEMLTLIHLAYPVPMAQGLWCADCQRHFMCLVCVLKVIQPGGVVVPEGLPHQKILKPCKVKNGWILYLTG